MPKLRNTSVEGRKFVIGNRVTLLAAIVTVLVALPIAAQTSDSAAGSDCICPKAGLWMVQNLKGKLDCGVFKRELDEIKDKGTIYILEEDCSRGGMG